MSSRSRLSYDIAIEDTGRTFNLQLSDPSDIVADNLALATWGSSQVLANLLHRLDVAKSISQAQSHDIPVLELGAGTGLVGISAAAIWRTSAVLTDLTPILPAIEANADLNRQVVSKLGGRVECGLLDWAQPETLKVTAGDKRTLLANVNKARIVLAADTMYSEEHPELLTTAISAWLARDRDARVVLCYPLRIGYLDHIRDMWSRFEEAGLVSIEEGREAIDQSWDEDVPYEWVVWKWRLV